jgi:mycothiol synthase
MTCSVRRPFGDERELAQVAELIAACQAVDLLETPDTVDDLRRELTGPTAGWTRETALWWSGADLRALACLWVSPPGDAPGVFLRFWIHPGARDGDLVRQVIAWGDERGCALVGTGALLTVGANEEEVWRLAVIPTLGFEPVRSFLTMTRRLDEPLPVAPPPLGYLIRPLAGESEIAAWVGLYNVAFADHWEHYDTSLEERRLDMERPGYRADLDLVAVAPDGTPAAFCAGALRELDDGSSEAWINLVGTHPAHRRRGLARALIAEDLARLREHGMTEAKLSVDAASPTGATSLYAALGFAVTKTVTVFRRPVRG